MKSISGKQLARALEQHGWRLTRIHGSLYIYCKEGKVERISIPIHGNAPLKIGLLRHLLKVAGLKEEDI